MKFSLPDLKTIWGKNKFLLTILALVVLLRLPSLFEPYWYGDEGIYLTLGQAVRKGLVLYRDIHDNKPPLLYLLAALADSLFWLRFLLLIWNLVTVFFFSKLIETLFPGKKLLSKIATTAFVLFCATTVIEGNIANAEIFMILPIIGGIILIFPGREGKWPRFLGAGILFSLATLFKIPAAFDFAAVLVFLAFFQSRKLLFTILGFSLPILASIIYFWSQGALNQYLVATFFQNLPYLSSWQTGAHTGGAGSGILIRGTFLLLVLGFVWLARKKWETTFSFLFIWFLFALFGATLSGRPYPHYLVQVLPPTILLLLVFPAAGIGPKAIVSFLWGLLLAATIYFRFWSYPAFTYYQNFLLFTLGQKTQEEYFRQFSPKVPQTYKLAQFLTTHTKPDEKVFIWGDSPMVYALARRLPVGRYSAAYHIIDFRSYGETIVALKKERPRFIIDLGDETHPFPQLNAFLSQNYLFLQKIDKAQIFRLALHQNDIIIP